MGGKQPPELIAAYSAIEIQYADFRQAVVPSGGDSVCEELALEAFQRGERHLVVSSYHKRIVEENLHENLRQKLPLLWALFYREVAESCRRSVIGMPRLRPTDIVSVCYREIYEVIATSHPKGVVATDVQHSRSFWRLGRGTSTAINQIFLDLSAAGLVQIERRGKAILATAVTSE